MQLDPAKLADHVKDANAFELPFHVECHLPSILGFQLTKFMVLEVAVALLMLLIFVPLARRLTSGEPVKGRLANLFELLILFLRNEVVRPAIGEHDADRFLPLILTLVLLHLLLQPDGPAPLARLADGLDQRHRRRWPPSRWRRGSGPA